MMVHFFNEIWNFWQAQNKPAYWFWLTYPLLIFLCYFHCGFSLYHCHNSLLFKGSCFFLCKAVFTFLHLYKLYTTINNKIHPFCLSSVGQPWWTGSPDQKRAGRTTADGRPDRSGKTMNAQMFFFCLFYLLIYILLLTYFISFWSARWKVSEICIERDGSHAHWGTAIVCQLANGEPWKHASVQGRRI